MAFLIDQESRIGPEDAAAQVRMGGINTSIRDRHDHVGAGQSEIIRRHDGIGRNPQPHPSQITEKSPFMVRFDPLHGRQLSECSQAIDGRTHNQLGSER